MTVKELRTLLDQLEDDDIVCVGDPNTFTIASTELTRITPRSVYENGIVAGCLWIPRDPEVLRWAKEEAPSK